MAQIQKTITASDLSVGQVATRSGVAVSTLHFYEKIGLIHSWRNKGNQRRYARDVLRRIAIIKVAQRAGIPLEIIGRALAELPKEGKITRTAWKKMSQAWRHDLESRITRLTRLRDELDQCIGCGCLSLNDCPLRNPDDRLAKKGAGAYYLERCNAPSPPISNALRQPHPSSGRRR